MTVEAYLPERPTIDMQRWVSNYSDYLYNYAISRLNDHEQAQDVVQETFLAGLQKAANFEGKSTEKTWLTAILRYKIIDIYRKKSSGLRFITIAHSPGLQNEDSFLVKDWYWKAFSIENSDLFTEKEFNQFIKSCLQKMPDLSRNLFTMKYIEDIDTKTICKELKMRPSNYWVTMHRVKMRLRTYLKNGWL